MPLIPVNIEKLKRIVEANQPKNKQEALNHLNSICNKLESSEEELQSAFSSMYPGEDLVIHDPSIRAARKALSEQAREAFFDMIADSTLRNPGPGVNREMQILFKPETSQASIDQNAILRKAIAEKDYATQAKFLEDRIKELPAFDPVSLISLSDEELVNQYKQNRAYIELTSEAENFLRSKEVMAQVSESTRKTLQEMKNNIDIFTAIKVRFEMISDPHYAVFDTDKLVQADLNAYLFEGFSKCAAPSDYELNDQLTGFSNLIASTSTYASMVTGALMKLEMEKDGLPLDTSRTFNHNMVEHAILPRHPLDNIEYALNKNEPLICRSGDGTITAYKMEGKRVVHTDPAAILDNALTSALGSELKNASKMLNSSAANPFWMLTGSSQYKNVKRSVAEFEKLVSDLGNPPKVQDYKILETALSALEKTTADYMTHKGVSPNEVTNIKSYKADFKTQHHKQPNSREIARMEGVLEIRHMIEKTRQAMSLTQDLQLQNTRKNEGAHVDMSGTAKMKVKLAYNKELPGAQHEGKELNGFNDLGKQIYNGLYGPEGLLNGNPRAFTPQQESSARELVAKMVVFDMIKRGREPIGETIVASPVEVTYNQNPDALVQSISGKINLTSVTPDSLQAFIIQDGQKKLSATMTSTELDLGTGMVADHTLQNDNNGPVIGNIG